MDLEPDYLASGRPWNLNSYSWIRCCPGYKFSPTNLAGKSCLQKDSHFSMRKNVSKRQKKKTKAWHIETKKYNSQNSKLNGWISEQLRTEEICKEEYRSEEIIQNIAWIKTKINHRRQGKRLSWNDEKIWCMLTRVPEWEKRKDELETIFEKWLRSFHGMLS